MLKILIVEDSLSIQMMLKLRLKRTNLYLIETANDGKEGVEKAIDIQPDIVLMDMHMPIMDGHEAVRTLREGGYDGIIVAVTASAMKSEVYKSNEAGCNGFISKPIGANFEQQVADFIAKGK